MSSEFAQSVLDRIPLLDGAMRRRLFSGVIVMLAILLLYENHLPIDKIMNDKILNSWIVGIFSLLIVFVFGSVVELLGTFFVKRGMASTIWAFWIPFLLFSCENLVLRGLLIFSCYLLVLPIIFTWILFLGVAGYRFHVPFKLEPGSDEILDSLNGFVHRAFRAPFEDALDPAWRKLADRVSAGSRRSTMRKFALSEDVAMVSAVLISVLAMYIPSDVEFCSWTGDTNVCTMQDRMNFAIPLFVFVIASSAYLYFLSIRSAIQTCIDLLQYEESYESTAAKT